MHPLYSFYGINMQYRYTLKFVVVVYVNFPFHTSTQKNSYAHTFSRENCPCLVRELGHVNIKIYVCCCLIQK